MCLHVFSVLGIESGLSELDYQFKNAEVIVYREPEKAIQAYIAARQRRVHGTRRLTLFRVAAPCSAEPEAVEEQALASLRGAGLKPDKQIRVSLFGPT